jgi:hypothetical protein
VEIEQPANVVLQIMDANLSLADRDRWVQQFWDDLTQLEIVAPVNITPLVDKSQDNTRYGLMVKLPEPECLDVWIRDIHDRLAVAPVTIRFTCTIDHLRVQAQTASAEEFLSLLATIDTLLPAHQIFRARATTYAYRGGEITPVERANLDLLRYRLQLDPEVAETIINQALGPYLNRQAKLEKYREVLNAELERQSPPLSDTTWAELQRLYQALGLSYEDVEPIDQEYITRIQAEATRLRMAEEATRLQQETELQEDVEQQELVMQQSYAEQYRQVFAGTIAHSLYPSEFDRGRLENARQNWALESELVRAIEREVTDERYGPIDSELGLDYSRLRQLLWLKQWQTADQETERLILMALSQDMRPLPENAVLKLSCIDLQTLNALWFRYSQGKFGFAAQHQVYVQHDRQASEFLTAIGWKAPVGLGGMALLNRPKAYRDLQFDLDAPVGHLPTWRWGADNLEGDYVVNEETVHNVFHDLVEKCLPGLPTSTAAMLPEAEGELS